MWKNGFFGLVFFRKKSIIGENNKFFKEKFTQDTPWTNTDVVCEFQLNRFSSLGAYSEQTNTQTNKHSQPQEELYKK